MASSDGIRRGARLAGVCVAATAVLTVSDVVLAQDTENLPGAEFYLDFSSGLDVSDNYERLRNPSGTSVVWLNTLGLTFDSATKNQRLTATGGFTYEAGYFADDPDGDGGGAINPYVGLDYRIENRSSLLALSASYAERDLGFDDDVVETADDIIVDEGTRSDFRLGADLTLGRNAPLTFTTSLDYRDTQYFDTTDPDLDDEIFYAAETILSVRLNRTTDLLFGTSYFERDEDDRFDTFETNRDARVGLSYRNNQGLTAVVSLGYAVNELTRTIDGERDTDRDDRPVGSINLTQARRNGDIRAGFEQSVNDEGRRTDLTFGRNLDLPRGSLFAEVGVSFADYDEELRGIGRLVYEQDLPRGSLNLRFSQRIVDDTDEDSDVFITTAGLSYIRPLTSISSFALDMDLSASEAVDADEVDNQRASLQLRYIRDLTEDWALNAGYRHSTFRESERDPIIENAVFATIERRFAIRP